MRGILLTVDGKITNFFDAEYACMNLDGTENFMFKIMVFGKRRSGICREAFIQAYEKDHLKLADRFLEDGTIPPMLHYRRNYICHDDPLNIGEIEFDVVTEAVFSDRASFEVHRSGLSEPEIARTLVEDMQKFLDLSDLRYLVVEEFSGGGGATG